MSRPKQSDLLNALFSEVRIAAKTAKKSSGYNEKARIIRGLLHPCQRILEADRAFRIAVRSARQVGKSTAVLFITLIRCLEKAESSWVIIGLTRPSIKRIYWGMLKKLNDEFELGIAFQHQELTATLPNGSKIYFVGAETIDEIEKLRGGRYHGVVVDEAKSYPFLLFQTLLEEVVEPALAGQGPGQLYVIGTPGDVMGGEFYEATCEPPILRETEVAGQQVKRWSNRRYGANNDGTLAVWSFHRWTLQDNVKRFERADGTFYTLWEEALTKKANHGWTDDYPPWRREYLGDWVAADETKVYRYRPAFHDYLPCHDTRWGLPGDKDASWRCMVGWDFGTRDGTAAVVWAFSPTEPGLWEVYSEKRKPADGQRLTVTDIANWYKELEAEYGPFDASVGDTAGLATMVLDTLAAEHEVYIEAAEKREKLDHIELFNTDLDLNHIHLRRHSELAMEMLLNRWLEKTLGTSKLRFDGVRKEDPATPNDLCDAGLYGYRWCRHRTAKPVLPPGPALFSPAWYQTVDAEDLKRLRAKKLQDQIQLDREWWHDS